MFQFLLMLVGSVLLAQEGRAPGTADIQVPSCGSCRGKQIEHTMRTIVFCVPRGLKAHREAGEEGELADTITLSRRDRQAASVFNRESLWSQATRPSLVSAWCG